MAITKVTLPTTLLVQYEDPQFGHRSLVLHSEEYYKDHGGEIRVKLNLMGQQVKQWAAIDDKIQDGTLKPEIEFKWKDALMDKTLEGKGKILALQNEVLLTLNAKDKKEVLKHARVSPTFERLASVADQLEKIANDHKVEGIADYLSNGYEHDDDEQALVHLQEEFGLNAHQSRDLLREWKKHFATKPGALNTEVFPFIKKFL